MTDKNLLRAKELFSAVGPILKAKELRANRFGSREIAELATCGYIQKVKTGYYVWSEHAGSLSDAEIAVSVVPFGVLCEFSAAQIHELTTVNPLAVSVAAPANRVNILLPEYPPIALIAYPIATFELGLSIGNGPVPLRVYDRERTVCDFFRKRNQLGEDAALEVLKNYMDGRRNLQTLFEYADKLHIKNVLKPYVEALL